MEAPKKQGHIEPDYEHFTKLFRLFDGGNCPKTIEVDKMPAEPQDDDQVLLPPQP